MPDVTRRDLTTRSISFRANTANEEARTVEAVLATDAPTMVFDWQRWEPVEETLVMDGLRMPEQVPLLDTHDRSSVQSILGSTRSLEREGGKLIGVRHFADSDRAKDAFAKIRDGHLTDGSIGYRVHNFVTVEPGKSARINGRTYKAGKLALRVSTEWELLEDSVAPIGADRHAKVRSNTGETKMDPALRKLLVGLGLPEDATDEQARSFFEDLPEGRRAALRVAAGLEEPEKRETPEPDNNPANPDPEAATRAANEALAAERKRIGEIRAAGGDDIPASLVNKAIDDGWPVDKARKAFLDHLRENRPEPVGQGPQIMGGGLDKRDDIEEALIGGVMHMAGTIDMVRFDDLRETERKKMERIADRGERFRDVGLIDICRHALHIAGQTVPTGRTELVRAATSSATLSNILGTSMTKRLLLSYEEQEDSTRGWCSEADVADYKLQERSALSKVGGFEELPEGDIAKHGTVSDTVETYKVRRFAKQIFMDEVAIINDDLSALSRLPDEMAAAAARLRPDLVYAILLANANLQDSVALFASGHANTGTAALAASALEAGLTAIAKQTENGVKLGIRGKHLIVPEDLAFTAEKIVGSILRDSSDGQLNPIRNRNIMVHSDDRIGAAGVTDPASGTAYTGSATNWFLAADPRVARTIEVGYLRGTNRRPVIRRQVDTPGRWGIGWDVKMDVGAKALDYRGLYRSTGAG